MGIAGFVVSLVGFLSCGLLSPIGLILSIIGMRKEPKGLAIAGLILGILGTIGTIIIFGFFGLGAILAILGVAAAAGQIEASFEMPRIASEIESYEQTNGSPPPDLSVLTLDQDTLEDHWDNTYRYTVRDDGTWMLSSDGEDGVQGTPDDITYDSATGSVSSGP